MKTRCNDTQRGQARALGAWENEGGAPAPDTLDRQYGRRIERDRSWTVYHVFTGVPGHLDGRAMTGLSRADATDRMVSLNRRAPSASGPQPSAAASGP